VPLISGRTGTQVGTATRRARQRRWAQRGLWQRGCRRGSGSDRGQRGSAAAMNARWQSHARDSDAVCDHRRQSRGAGVAPGLSQREQHDTRYAQTARYSPSFRGHQALRTELQYAFQDSGIALQGEISIGRMSRCGSTTSKCYSPRCHRRAGALSLSAPGVRHRRPAIRRPDGDALRPARCIRRGSLKGWELHDSYQAQFTLTKAVSNVLAASQL
jgi:hypothetical protein